MNFASLGTGHSRADSSVFGTFPQVSEVDVLAELPDVVHREALGGGRCIK